MWDYRETMSKRECLFNAIIWSILPLLWLVIALLWWEDGQWYGFALAAMNVLACVFHWRRYLRYDRNREEGKAGEE